MTMRVLVACEFSGVVRDAFRCAGHNAMSCDFLPSETPGLHYNGDVLDILDKGWDLMIAHPPCTYLCNSGVRWLHSEKLSARDHYLIGIGVKDHCWNSDRWNKMVKSAEFFKLLLNADIDKICIENPIPHKYAVEIIGRKYDEIIQPWQFGHGETKKTCLWLKNLRPLSSDNVVEGREHRIHRMGPSPNRSKERSRTYLGIAKAMAKQWG